MALERMIISAGVILLILTLAAPAAQAQDTRNCALPEQVIERLATSHGTRIDAAAKAAPGSNPPWKYPQNGPQAPPP